LVEYLRRVADASPRVNLREIGPSTHGRPFVLLEISSESNLAHLDFYKRLQRRLYFQDHQPGQGPDSAHTAEERREIFERHKAVVLITCSIHATEVGAAQMSLELEFFRTVPVGKKAVVANPHESAGEYVEEEPAKKLESVETHRSLSVLVHQLATSDDPRILKILDGVIFLLVPALNPNGQASAALETAGKSGIIYDFTYTNFWEGAMAWTGWWHNQVGMLTEVASVRIATPTEQRLAKLGEAPAGPAPDFRQVQRQMMARPDEPLPPPRDVTPRTNYPRPWLGGKWTLRDIVEYEKIATLGLLESAADTRRQLLEQIYEVNRTTIAEFLKGQKRREEPDELRGYPPLPAGVAPERAETGRVIPGASGAAGTPYAVVVPLKQHDPLTATKMLQLLERGGVRIERATSEFEAGGKTYAAGTHVIRLAQVFGRYAKDMLEAQTYPEVRAAPSLPPQPPYDVTAWSLGMMMGVETAFIDEPFEASLELVKGVNPPPGRVVGRGNTFIIDGALSANARHIQAAV
jgi:hypothetical protein